MTHTENQERRRRILERYFGQFDLSGIVERNPEREGRELASAVVKAARQVLSQK